MTVEDLMSKQVVTMQQNHTVEQARRLIHEHGVTAIPVVGDGDELRGIVSTTDLAADLDGDTPVKQVMNEGVYAIPTGMELHLAAQMMRNQHIHRVVVVEEKRVVGILSAFDLLKLVEDKRW